MKSKHIKNMLSVIALSTLAACSGSGSCNSTNGDGDGGGTNTGDLSKLTFTAPNIVPSMPTLVGQGYIVANNGGTTALNHLTYYVTSPIGGGSGITVDPVSAAECKEIPAQGNCVFKVFVPKGTVAGSFVMNARQVTTSSLAGLLSNKQGADINPSTVIGIQQSLYNNQTGANGIGLYYYTTVIAGTTYVIVTGAVNSANVGSFNNVVLVDGNNSVLPNQQAISGNLGAGLTNLAQGATFAIMLPVPAGSDATQVIKIQTQEVAADGKVSNIQTGTLSYNLSTTSNVGIVNLLPGAVYLTSDNPEQILTFYNNGDAAAQLQSIVSSNPNIELVFNPANLNANGTSTATLKLKNTSTAATTGSVTLTYNNGQADVSQTGSVDQNVDPAPTPTPTPTPSPKPPAPIAGLTATYTPANFDATTANLTATRTVTLKNTGTSNETGFAFTFTPSGAYVLGDGTAPACTISGTTVTSILAPNEECNLTITYTSPNTSAGSYTGSVNIAYNYNGSVAALPLNQSFNTNISQSSANLSSVANTVNDFGSLPDNNSATSQLAFKLHNSGEASASALTFTNSSSTLFSLYSLSSPTPVCITNGSGTLAAGADCYYGVQFGAVASATPSGTESNTTTVNYAWSSGGASAAPSITQTMSGIVTTSTVASIALSGPVANGFAGGDGTSGTPYQTQVSTPATLTYTYTNTGTQAANSFYVANTTLPSGWTRSVTSTCPATSGAAITLDNTGTNSCTVVFTINKGSSGASNFNQSVMTANWIDQANPGGATQPATTSTSYTNVYAAAVVTAVMSSSTTGSPTITNPTANTDFYIVYTLTGGYNVNMSYGVSFGGTAGTPAMQVKASTPTTCAVTTANPTCYITISSGGAATAQSITYSPVIPAIAPTPASSGSFDVNQLYLNIYVTSTTVDTSVNQTGTVTAAGAITSADSICNSDANKPSASVSIGSMTYKALFWSNGLRQLGTDWPIKASTKYQTTQNGASPLLLGTSDANGVLYSLAYQINPTNGGYSFLAGIVVDTTNQTWTGGYNCTNWTDTTTVAQTNGAYYGFTGNWYQPPYWIEASRDYCKSAKVMNLLCVEQPAVGP